MDADADSEQLMDVKENVSEFLSEDIRYKKVRILYVFPSFSHSEMWETRSRQTTMRPDEEEGESHRHSFK